MLAKARRKESANRVRDALDKGPRTDDEAIEIIDNNAGITLRGRVRSAEIREAAVQIVMEQKGEIEVINDLEVSKEDDSPAVAPRL